MRRSNAEIIREYGPFAGVDHVRGVTYDGQHVWIATGTAMQAVDPSSGTTRRSIELTVLVSCFWLVVGFDRAQ